MHLGIDGAECWRHAAQVKFGWCGWWVAFSGVMTWLTPMPAAPDFGVRPRRPGVVMGMVPIVVMSKMAVFLLDCLVVVGEAQRAHLCHNLTRSHRIVSRRWVTAVTTGRRGAPRALHTSLPISGWALQPPSNGSTPTTLWHPCCWLTNQNKIFRGQD